MRNNPHETWRMRFEPRSGEAARARHECKPALRAGRLLARSFW
jgi:hypothetical protein